MLVNLGARAFLSPTAPVSRSYIEISRLIRSGALWSLTTSACRRVSRAEVAKGHRNLSQRSSSGNATSSLDSSALKLYMSTYWSPKETHQLENLTKFDVGAKVVLYGYLGSRVDTSKALSFVPLLSKDLLHSIQIVSLIRNKDAHLTLKVLTQHTPVAIKGTVQTKQQSKKPDLGDVKKIGDIEIQLSDVTPLNSFPQDVMLTTDTKFTPEERHLQLRASSTLRNALKFRSEISNYVRKRLSDSGFVEVETPILFKSTPEGAREFLVPTRHKGKAYALPQSPQQYKQILMASGISKYFQLARCFRDEDLRADRQPEFTQIDLEVSFANGETVMEYIEVLIRSLWSTFLQVHLPSTFRRVSYVEAMARYGSDKPDTRIGMEIFDLSDLLPADLVGKVSSLSSPSVDAMKLRLGIQASETRKFVKSFMESPDAVSFLQNSDGQPGIFIYDESQPLSGLQPLGFEAADAVAKKLDLKNGDLVVLQARQDVPFTGGSTTIGRLRLALHKAAVSAGLLRRPSGFEFIWITDFPLFSPTTDTEPGQGGAAGLSSTHHPFTAPRTVKDVQLLASDPASAKADHYDLVVNGVELGGGSRRIHSAQVQEYVLRDVLRMSDERVEDFRHLLDVLHAGCPPHAGIALGFDRLITVMLELDSVRDVIAFPKSGSGEDVLVKSPNVLTAEQLATYHLQLKE